MNLDDLAKAEGIKYNKYGKMEYNPIYHDNHKKPFTEDEEEYICKFIEFDGPKTVGFALGRTEKTITTKACDLKKEGLYELYKLRGKNYV